MKMKIFYSFHKIFQLSVKEDCVVFIVMYELEPYDILLIEIETIPRDTRDGHVEYILEIMQLVEVCFVVYKLVLSMYDYIRSKAYLY